jgi:small subunit ribosomal protein S9
MAEKITKTTKTKKTKKADFFTGTGRRKTSTARVWLFAEKGEFTVNDKNMKDLFVSGKDTLDWIKPFHAVGVSHPQAKFSATIKVAGGGIASQLDAIQMGLARALLKYDETLKPILRASGLLTRDSRKKERKKPYLRKARKAPQYSKR